MQNNKIILKITKEIAEKCRNPFYMKKELEARNSFQSSLSLTDEQLAALHDLASGLIEQKRYSDAANAFLFLSAIAGTRMELWLGLGLANQLQEDFESAIDAYEIAVACDIEHPLPYLYLGNVYFALHKRDLAAEAIELALASAAVKSEYSHIEQQALKAKAQLQKHL